MSVSRYYLAAQVPSSPFNNHRPYCVGIYAETDPVQGGAVGCG